MDSPRVCSNSCPLSRWCYLTISSSATLFSFNLSQHQGLFQWLALHIRWPKYWSVSFSISPARECLGLISFRIDCFDLLAVQASSPAPQVLLVDLRKAGPPFLPYSFVRFGSVGPAQTPGQGITYSRTRILGGTLTGHLPRDCQPQQTGWDGRGRNPLLLSQQQSRD